MRAVPDLGQSGVVEHLHRLEVAPVLRFPCLFVLLGQRCPVLPAERCVQRIEVEADGFTVTIGVGTPFTSGKHVALVVFLDQHIAFGSSALVMHCAEVRRVQQPFPLQNLHVPAGWAWHVVVTLVAGLEQVSDTRGALDGRRAGEVELGVTAKGTAPSFSKLNRVALFVYVYIPAVDLIAVNEAGRQFSQVGGRASRGRVQRATLKLFGVHRVARIPRTWRGNSLAQHRGCLDGLADPRRHPLGQAQAGQQGQDIGWRHMNQGADPVQRNLSFHQLRRHHCHHPLAGVTR
ncbi:hypothetical protein D3C77_275950 [compost metagenome]